MGDYARKITSGTPLWLDLDSDDDVSFTKEINGYEETFYISRHELLEWLATLPPIED